MGSSEYVGKLIYLKISSLTLKEIKRLCPKAFLKGLIQPKVLGLLSPECIPKIPTRVLKVLTKQEFFNEFSNGGIFTPEQFKKLTEKQISIVLKNNCEEILKERAFYEAAFHLVDERRVLSEKQIEGLSKHFRLKSHPELYTEKEVDNLLQKSLFQSPLKKHLKKCLPPTTAGKFVLFTLISFTLVVLVGSILFYAWPLLATLPFCGIIILALKPILVCITVSSPVVAKLIYGNRKEQDIPRFMTSGLAAITSSTLPSPHIS